MCRCRIRWNSFSSSFRRRLSSFPSFFMQAHQPAGCGDLAVCHQVSRSWAYRCIHAKVDYCFLFFLQVLFKMDPCGDGVFVDLDRLSNVTAVNLTNFTPANFRHLCILSGCDYLLSISGVGLVTALKWLRKCGLDPIKVSLLMAFRLFLL